MKKKSAKAKERKLSKLLLFMLGMSGSFVLLTILISLASLRQHLPGNYWGLIQALNGVFLFGIWKRRKAAVVAFILLSVFILFQSVVFYIANLSFYRSSEMNTLYVFLFPLFTIPYVFLWTKAFKSNWPLFT